MSGKPTEPFDIFDGDPFDPDVIAAAEDAKYDARVNVGTKEQEFLRARAAAYKQVFNRDDPAVRIVLADLAMFTRVGTTRYHVEDKKQNMLEGRAEVFHRIQQHTLLSADDLFLIYTRAVLNQ